MSDCIKGWREQCGVVQGSGFGDWPDRCTIRQDEKYQRTGLVRESVVWFRTVLNRGWTTSYQMDWG